MLNNIDAFLMIDSQQKVLWLSKMIASRLPSVITRQLDWWYHWVKTAKLTELQKVVVGHDNGVKDIFTTRSLKIDWTCVQAKTRPKKSS